MCYNGGPSVIISTHLHPIIVLPIFTLKPVLFKGNQAKVVLTL